MGYERIPNSSRSVHRAGLNGKAGAVKGISERLRVAGRGFRLADRDPDSTPGCKKKDEAQARIARNIARIDELQYQLYAEDRRSLLIVLQGRDASGKDGTIRKVFTATIRG